MHNIKHNIVLDFYIQYRQKIFKHSLYSSDQIALTINLQYVV